ncbi:SDR family oxidoreductase [Nocardia farcinica]|uniref:7-alpha-hydroxysteroid dehydrogenase n=2 Tax=Nocardia farcinica TaxID=37329 RepID=A0A0H5P0U5_NOCFR|nr:MULTISPECIES: SDR family oxidoreductase [Nocardia]SLH15343.1 short chain dehydrogenase [Mycobacteroides abscessus subsp. abscessus]AXK85020.1 SDR family oxidoreductase [Nocardia farcinica]MBA4855414.1 SDR family oxidoreductase [Nocardia farcinica]MBC9818247.1 SDR family oxidoreductase [Nocardia farcinica]MBF6140917.1 SDR family oxidoreductase [Nocardia farcinica]
MLLQDKVVVVSGVGPGLGRAIAVQSAKAGADVVLASRTESRLTEVAKEIGELGRRALAVPTDIRNEDAVRALVETTRAEFGRVDTVVNNAFAIPPLADLAEVDLDQVRAGFETNVLAALRLTRAFIPDLAASTGSVVMINSAVLHHSRRTFGPYKMAKSSLLALAQSLATELGPQGIRVNSVAPGYIWADNLKWYFNYLAEQRGITAEEVYAETASTIDLRKLPEPDEIADAVVFFASSLARAITGACLDVNAGEYHH